MRKMDEKLVLFQEQKIRRHPDEKLEKRYFSVIDIVWVLVWHTDYQKAKSYWTTLKNRLKAEWSEVVTNCDQLKMLAQDGKMRLTDLADVETILRLVQYIKKI